MPVKRTIKSNCTCGRFEEIDKKHLTVREGEDKDMNKGWFPYWDNTPRGQINFCDGCGGKIWVQEEIKKGMFPPPLYYLEADLPMPQKNTEVALNRAAINDIVGWIKKHQEAHND